MIRTLSAAAAALVIAMPALAGPFDGTWKADPSTFKASAKPYTRLLAKGHYHCTCSNPPEDFDADGKFHPTTGHTGYDEAEATVQDARSVHFAYRLKGKAMAEVTTTLSADGKTATDKWTDTSTPHTVTGSSEEVRVGPAPAGAHAISGDWRDSDKTSFSDTGLSTTVSQSGSVLKVTNSDGTSFAAPIDGAFVKIDGSSTGTMVSVARAGAHALTITYKYGDKVIQREAWTYAPDGKSVRVTLTDVPSGRVMSMTATKQ